MSTVIGLAHLQEEKQIAQCHMLKPHFTQSTISKTTTTTLKETLFPIKRSISIEAKAWRDKGLYYNYNEKFSPSYRCKSKQVFLIGGDSDNEVKDAEEETNEEAMEDVAPKISMHAISGSPSLR